MLLIFALGISFVTVGETLSVCSFNIKWLGYSEERDNVVLGRVLSIYDVIVIQEIVAPPYTGQFPNGDSYKPDPEVAVFFDEMTRVYGYAFLLSEKDTGPGGKINDNSSRTEWYAVFYDPTKLEVASDLPTKFLPADVTADEVFDRIPYAFSLRHRSTGFDFTLVSVHLKTGSSHSQKRALELDAISAWVVEQQTGETHYVILGDMNFDDCEEIRLIVPDEFLFLNPDENGICLGTNTGLGKRHPYDNVLLSAAFPWDREFRMKVIDLVTGLSALWNPFGEPIDSAYDKYGFVKMFSDHNPIVFRIEVPLGDSD